MSDPLQQVVPGQKVAPTARTWNTFVDAARRASRTRFAGLGGGLAGGDGVAAVTVLVRNDTGGDLTAGKVLALTGVVVDPTDYPDEVRRGPVFTGDTPADEGDPFVVLAEAVPDGEIGRGVILGIAVCEVHYAGSVQADFMYASPTTSTAYMKFTPSGPARILWHEGGVSPRLAVVMIDKDPLASFTAGGTVGLGSPGGLSTYQDLGRGTKRINGALQVYQDEDWGDADANSAGGDFVAAKLIATEVPGYASLEYRLTFDADGSVQHQYRPATGAPFVLKADNNTLTVDGRFGVRASGTDHAGVTGTSGGGDTVYGGIITALGSGGAGDFDGGTW